jgi:hypothetical protein
MDYAGIEPELLQCEPGAKAPELWHSMGFLVSVSYLLGKCGNILITSSSVSCPWQWEIYGDMF